MPYTDRYSNRNCEGDCEYEALRANLMSLASSEVIRIVESKSTAEFCPAMKLVVLSHSLPPSPSGQAVVLYRLLKDLNPNEYCLLSRTNYDGPDDQHTSFTTQFSKLPARYYHQPPGFQLGGFGRPEMQTVGRVFNTL